MRALSIHIVEDESIIAQDLKEILEELGHKVEGISMSYQEVLEKLPTMKVDVFFLDIMLQNSKTGIDVAAALQEKNTPFIYVSSVTEKAMIEKVKHTIPYGFILKPFNPEDVYIGLELAIARIDLDQQPEAVYISVGAGKERILLEDVLYIQADGNYSHIFTNGRKLTLNDNLKTVQAEFFDQPNFKRVHKSYLVNMTQVLKIVRNTIHLKDGSEVPKSRAVKIE